MAFLLYVKNNFFIVDQTEDQFCYEEALNMNQLPEKSPTKKSQMSSTIILDLWGKSYLVKSDASLCIQELSHSQFGTLLGKLQ